MGALTVLHTYVPVLHPVVCENDPTIWQDWLAAYTIQLLGDVLHDLTHAGCREIC